MELRPAYRQTDLGLIPKEWEIRLLASEIERLDAGVSVNSIESDSSHYVDGASVLKTSSVSDGAFLPDECKPIAAKDIHRASLSPRRDTIIISRMNTPDLVGECGYVEHDYPHLFLPDRLWMTVFRGGRQICVRWLAFLLSSAKYKSTLKSIATGTSGSMKNISKGSLLALAIPFPHVDEQYAIVAALSDVDALIRALDRLSAKKRDLKQAAMQQLLTGKTRLPGFCGEWEKKKLGDIGVFRGGNGFPRRNQGVLEGDYPFFKVSDMNNDGNTTFMVNSNNSISEAVRKELGAYAFPPHSIVFAKIGAAIFLERKKILSQASCIDNNMMGFILARASAHHAFIHFLFLTIRLGNLVSTTALPSLNGNQVAELQFPIPPIDEQCAIATVLSDMDSEIAALERRCDKTRDLKQGMMQELLTGRTRLI